MDTMLRNVKKEKKLRKEKINYPMFTHVLKPFLKTFLLKLC